jgi:hypothetical protein
VNIKITHRCEEIDAIRAERMEWRHRPVHRWRYASSGSLVRFEARVLALAATARLSVARVRDIVRDPQKCRI